MTRYGRLLDDMLRKHRHASEEDILAFLDGELTARHMDRVRRHLESCWSCRAASDETGQTVASFVEYRRRSLSMTAAAWPVGQPSLEARLRDVPAPPVRRFPRNLLAAPVLALLAAAVLIFRLASTAPVSATAVLENARRAEQSPEARGSRMTYRKLAVRRSSGAAPLQTAVYEVWADGLTSKIRRSGAVPLLAEIAAVFEANNRRQPPLSAAGFESWRNRVLRKREVVLAGRSADADVLTVKTEVGGPLEDNAIREAQIVIRTDNWTPVAETISVGERLYEFEAVESRLVDRGSIPSDDLGPPSNALRVPAADPASVARKTDPQASPQGHLLEEIWAHYALHRLKACLDGAVEIIPRAGEVLVRGVVESEPRKAELETALADIQAVRVQLQLLDSATMTRDAAPISAGDVITIESRPSPLSEGMREYFKANPDSGTPSERAAKLANEAVSQARELRRNSWAVRRLAERFPDSSALGRSAPSRWLLEVMIRDHAGVLDRETGALQGLLDPLLHFLGSSSPEPDRVEVTTPPFGWQPASAVLFGVQQEVETLIHELFSGDGQATGTAATASRLRARLTDLQKQVRLLSEQVSGNLANLHSKEVIP